ncbi:MAG: hypothetical protein E2O68_03110 [Deltaproteobacteria bacterium]|nr:MAG: hypothetical protein E2O68_03110 [Deltaproteobacteria bacterium]
MPKFSVFLFIFSLSLSAQDKETPQQKEQRCNKELKEKCDPNLSEYTCIMDGINEKEPKFSKDCAMIYVGQIQKGTHPNPCIAERQALCPPGSPIDCIRTRSNSLSTECQEAVTPEGTPKFEYEEEVKKIQAECETGLTLACDYLSIEMEMAIKEEKMDRGIELSKQYSECVQRYMKKPADEKCDKSMKEFVESFKK